MKIKQSSTKSQAAIAFALISLIMSISELLQPQLTRPTGRWSFLFGSIWDAFGSNGIAIYWLLISLVLAIFFFRSK